jgi:midasin
MNCHLTTGVLVEAMRKGHWIILDELNLAPSDVLEALNRVLDDNRELFIPETQETVRAHPHFMLFATQNPPGLYGGRKVCEILSYRMVIFIYAA